MVLNCSCSRKLLTMVAEVVSFEGKTKSPMCSRWGMGWILPSLECDRVVPLLVFSKADSWRGMERVMRGVGVMTLSRWVTPKLLSLGVWG